LADALSAGRLDVAMIPSIEYCRHPGYRIVSDACIACDGPVRSVKLYSRAAVEQIRSLALDEGSRTSAALVRILLKEQYDLEPAIQSLPIGADAENIAADAVLLIGDRGFLPHNGPFHFEWDLGERWTQWTGLPFVFATWVARRDCPDFRAGEKGTVPFASDFEAQLSAARDEGVKQIPDIARIESAKLGVPERECLVYLRDHLHFFLGRREREGLNRFYQLAGKHGFASAGVNIENDHGSATLAR
jgi:chorismate dehydratase